MMSAASRSLEPGPQGARTSQRAGDALLALVTLPGDLGQQRRRVLVGSGRVGQDAVNGPDAGHDLAQQCGERRQLALRVLG